jgi:hypothetical protein
MTAAAMNIPTSNRVSFSIIMARLLPLPFLFSRNLNGKPVLTEMPNDAAAEKPGSAENSNGAIVHGRRTSN